MYFQAKPQFQNWSNAHFLPPLLPTPGTLGLSISVLLIQSLFSFCLLFGLLQHHHASYREDFCKACSGILRCMALCCSSMGSELCSDHAHLCNLYEWDFFCSVVDSAYIRHVARIFCWGGCIWAVKIQGVCSPGKILDI